MSASFSHVTLVQDEYLIAIDHSRESMGNYDGGSALGGLIQGLVSESEIKVLQKIDHNHLFIPS